MVKYSNAPKLRRSPMNQRKFTYLLMLVLLAFALTGCKGRNTNVDQSNSQSSTPDTTVSPDANQNSSTDLDTDNEENNNMDQSSTDTIKGGKNQYESTTALELAALMGNGMNLGNTMEAYGHTTLGTTSAVSTYETLWGQPVTTQEMIDSMKAAGFDTLRVPIAWTNAMNFESGDYTIGEDYLNRVEEIINYALNADMFVIINDHWDGGWWGKFGSATQEIRDAAMDQYISMWTQIANRYKDYDDRLIFESANEELGDRLNDIDLCPDSGTLSEDECYAKTNEINQTFVDTIRSTGGNNEQRFLLIAGYNTDIARTSDDRYIMPKDSANKKLLISVHYYTPWGYCGNSSLSTWGTVSNYEEQNDLLAMMKKFTDQGYGVVIGEYAVALNDDGSVKENTSDFFENFLNNCDMYGYSPLLWDCSNLFIRRDLGFFDTNVSDVFLKHSYAAQTSLTAEEVIANAKTSIETALANAIENDASSTITALPADQSVAWIMFNSGDWSIMYSVGDTYDPNSKTDGLVATDVEITGAGTYTVSLDFTGTGAGYADSTVFSALGIANGELLYPGYVINIKEVKVNGEIYQLKGKPYTSSDDQICTRVNLYNEYVNKVPDTARTMDGSLNNASASLFDKDTLGQIKTLSITFDYVAGR